MAKDPPIGRIGYVISGFGTERQPGQGGKLKSCVGGCRKWFDGRLYVCPHCGHPRPGFNDSLRMGQLNNHLLGYADIAKRQPSAAPNITSDVHLPPAA